MRAHLRIAAGTTFGLALLGCSGMGDAMPVGTLTDIVGSVVPTQADFDVDEPLGRSG